MYLFLWLEVNKYTHIHTKHTHKQDMKSRKERIRKRCRSNVYVPRNVGIYTIWGFSDCTAQWSVVVGPDYYTELADHYSSSSDQLAIARIRVYAGKSSFTLTLGYNFQQLWPYHDSG